MNKFIQNYLTYTKYTETPELIHLWCALSCLAGAAERRVWLDRGMFKIYGNLYVILIAPPGVAAKSTSIGYLLQTLRRCNYNIFEDQSTKEKIIDNAAGGFQLHVLPDESKFPHTSMTYAMSELNVLLASGTDMVLFLTRIWDEYNSYISGTIKRGTKEIINPYFNLIGAATPDWFSKAMDNDMLSVGFLARCIIVFATKRRRRVSKTRYGPVERKAQDNCVDVLNWMKNTFGEIRVTDEAESWYDNWYMNLTDEYEDDAKLGGYYDRKAKSFMPKIAMLLALGDCRTTIQVHDLENALKIFDYTEPAMQSCYALSGANKLAPYTRMLVKMILKNDGVLSYSEVLRQLYCELKEEDIIKVIDIGRNMGLITHATGFVKISDKKAAKKFLAR